MEEYVNVKVKGTEQRTRYSCSKVNALWFRGGKLVSPMTMEASLHYFLFIISNLSDSLNIKQHTYLSQEVASGPPNVKWCSMCQFEQTIPTALPTTIIYVTPYGSDCFFCYTDCTALAFHSSAVTRYNCKFNYLMQVGVGVE
eukprot:scaffold11766_cov154-Skeletonema_marinoi.AAC.1